ncbi:hypothetical protein ACQY0O_003389 [Thecaphora frezii]
MVTTRSMTRSRPRVVSPHFAKCRTGRVQAAVTATLLQVATDPKQLQETDRGPRSPLLGRPARRRSKRIERSKYFVQEPPEPAEAVALASSSAHIGAGRRRAERTTKIQAEAKPDAADATDETTPSRPFTVHALERSSNFYGLIQELVSPNVFRLLVATCLLNQTRGRAAMPIFWRLLSRWPDEHALAQASLAELTELLQPLGLHNIRAKRLIEMSKAMVEIPHDPANRFKARSRGCPLTPIGAYPGVGRYAVDSYRIFIADGGAQKGLAGERPVAPAELRLREQLDRQMKIDAPKSETVAPEALDATIHRLATVTDKGGVKPAAVAAASDVAVTAPNAEDGVAEWKKVLPLDKELRAYLIWRWAKEGFEWHPERGVVGKVVAASS